VIFEKYYHRHIRNIEGSLNNEQEEFFESEEALRNNIWSLLLCTPPLVNSYYFAGRIFIFIVMVIWGARFIFAPIESNFASHSFMHLINLPFHEAGHFFSDHLGPL